MSDETERVGVDEGPVRVLLVDDNEQWAQFIADDIEENYPELAVEVALSPNEAMLQLQETAVDCVVADYQMPEVDGIQLLERVRADHSDLPFILVTGEGSEEVASRAIEAGVSDYLVKDPRVDQTAMFASKILNAVEQYRLQQAITESERRYRTLTEQSRDAICILQGEELVFHNQRLVELTGRTAASLRDSEDLCALVHPDDRTALVDVLDDAQAGNDDGRLHEVRIVSAADEVRHCEYTTREITFEGEPATMLSIRDVTQREQRKRELEWERDLNRNVQNVLVESRTRAELERAFVEQLTDYGYGLAWVGGLDGGDLTPRVTSGDEGYLDGLDRSLAGSEAASEPSLWAARAGESRFVDDFTDLFETDWRERALDRGYRAGAAMPLVYNDVSYGVLAVYHAEAGRFDDTERRLLGELAETLAFAVHNIETEQALASDHTVEVTLRVDDEGYYLVDVVRDLGLADAAVDVRGTVRRGDGEYIQYLTVHVVDPDTIQSGLADHPDVQDVEAITDGERARFQVVLSDPTPEAHLMDRGVVVRSTTVGTAGADLEVELPARDDVRETVDWLGEAVGSVTVLSVVETARQSAQGEDIAVVDTSALTDKQAAALEAAFHQGYFERSRQSSATEVAESLDVSHSTFLQHLRAAQQKLFADLYR